MKHYEIIILGGGASGCLCGIVAGNRGKKVLIIDKDLKPAKKILVTGNGRCNLTNLNMSSTFFNQNIDLFLDRFSSQNAICLFEKLGLLTYADSEGRVYPLSNTSKSVCEILNLSLYESGVDFCCGEVISVTKDKGFIIQTSTQTFSCDKLVFALGGSGIIHAKEWFKENITTPKASLVAIKTNPTRSLFGVKISNCKATLILQDGREFCETGEVLFKDSGLSGICIFNLSSLLARGFTGKKISLDLLPQMQEETLQKLLKERKLLPRKISNIFQGIFPAQIGYEILNRAKIEEEKFLKDIDDKEIETLVKIIKNLEFDIKGIYDNNQVVSGGVKLSSLTKDLESKEHKNLFFIGEACDVDGLCGGYNLQWAWTSGKIVGDKL